MTAAALLPRAIADESHDPLEEIIFHKAFGRERVILSSGKESSFYFDMKPAMLDPEGAFLIAERILGEAIAVSGDFVGGLEIGAVPITGAVALRSYRTGHPIQGFFVRKKPKEHGAKKQIEGLRRGESLSGRRVVVVDDVTTSGASALIAVEACEAEGAKIALVVSIVDREEGAAQVFAERKIPFKSLYQASTFLSRRD
jgi:orotate phosphoribosyltransferase